MNPVTVYLRWSLLTRFGRRTTLVLVVATVVLHKTWTQADSDRLAAALAHSICAQRPRPDICVDRPARDAAPPLDALAGRANQAAAAVQPISCAHRVLTQGYGPVDFWMEPAVHGAAHFHTGWDLACPAGTPIRSVTAGTAHVDLATACDGRASGFGRNVQVHAGNDWVRYGHMSSVLVGEGQAVAAGMVLGLEGSTGCSTGPHLHFEVDRGCPTVACSIDPSAVLKGVV